MNLKEIQEHINRAGFHTRVLKSSVSGSEYLIVARNAQYVEQIKNHSYPEGYFFIDVENTLAFIEVEGARLISVARNVEDVLSCIEILYKIDDSLNKRNDFNRLLSNMKQLGFVVLLHRETINIYKHSSNSISELDEWTKANWNSSTPKEVITLTLDDTIWQFNNLETGIVSKCDTLYQAYNLLEEYALKA